MSSFIFILIAAVVILMLVLHKPKNDSDEELRKWFSSKLTQISTGLEKDIDKDKKGEYPHEGKQSFAPRGAIVYVLLDKKLSRLDVSDKNYLSKADLLQTEGYKQLATKAGDLGLSVLLEEKEVEGDGVDSFIELDEYIDDFPRYYTVTVTGW